MLAGDKQPPNVVIHGAVNEVIFSADDIKTCIANFRDDQRAQVVIFRLHLTRCRAGPDRGPRSG